MRLLLATLLLLALSAAPAASAAPRVQTLVVARDGAVLAGPKAVRAKRTSVAAGRARCRVAEATPLAALAALRRAGGPSFAARRFGGCGALYVSAIAGRRASGLNGWVYKVGRRAGTAGAADPGGPFGTGRRLRSGHRLLWFWCVQRVGGCQRTLEVQPASRRVRRGGTLRVTVRGYDDFGRGRRVRGAVVRLGARLAVTNASGVATLRAPRRGGFRVRATRAGMVPAFPARMRVG